MTQTATTTRTITSYGADQCYIDGLTKGPRAGWTWDGDALSHPAGIRLRFAAEATARITAAVAAYQPQRQLTGYQIQQLPESDRTGWEYIGVHNEVHGMYAKGQPRPGRCEVDLSEITDTGAMRRH